MFALQKFAEWVLARQRARNEKEADKREQREKEYIASSFTYDPANRRVIHKADGRPVVSPVAVDGHWVSLETIKSYLKEEIPADEPKLQPEEKPSPTQAPSPRKAPSGKTKYPSTGVPGVQQVGSSSFQAVISLKGKPKYLGTFPSIEHASSVYLEAKRLRDAPTTSQPTAE